MDRDTARALLDAVAAGTLAPDAALDTLVTAPYEALAHSLVDLHRELRTGDPEVVYGAGKTTAQLLDVVAALRAGTDRAVLVTRCSADAVGLLTATHPDCTVDGATVAVGALPAPRGTVAVLSAGTSDAAVAAEAALTVRAFGAAVERVDDVGVAGLHRLLAARPALERSDAVVVVAGMEGALASVVAGLVPAPVVAVPTSTGYGASLAGVTALLGMLASCSPGITVVGIDNGFGAACAVLRLLRPLQAGGAEPVDASPGRLA